MAPPRETVVVKNFRSLVQALSPGCFTHKNHQTNFSGSGFPDLIVVFESQVLFLEAKRGNEDLSSGQETTLREIANAGGYAGVLRGGKTKHEFHLTPWLSEDDEDGVVTMRTDGSMTKDQLRNKLKEFVDVCIARCACMVRW